MFLGERIRQAREIRGLTQEQLAGLVKKSKASIAQAEVGMTLPSVPLIEAIAFETKFPLSFFDSEPHVEFPMSEILLRANKSVKRREVLDTVRFTEHVFSIFVAVAAKAKPIPILVPNMNGDPAEAAQAMRRAMGVRSNEPLGDLIHRAERLGVCILLLPPLEGREAFCVWVKKGDREYPVIAASATREDGDRYRLSVAHELGHLTLHKSFLRKSNAEVEQEAFAFGAELLMPEEAMRKEIIPPFTLTSFAKLKPKWGVSMAALIRRAHELRIITTRQYHYLFQQLSASGMKTREPKNLDVPVEKPRLFRKLIELQYGEPIDFNRLSAETCVLPQELRRIILEYRSKQPQTVATVTSRKVLRFPGAKSLSTLGG